MNTQDWDAVLGPKPFGKVLVLTGAGLSAASGLPTFRGAGGLYEGRKVEDLATPEGFARDPELVWRWYSARIEQVLAAEPNPGHRALAEWESLAESFAVVSSNVDDLHERAGSQNLYKLHGAILEARHPQTGEVFTIHRPPPRPPAAPDGVVLRPNVVWFGERPRQDALHAALQGLQDSDLVIEAGVSGYVDYGFTEAAMERGLHVVCINPNPTFRSRRAKFVLEPSEAALPAMLAAAKARIGRG